MKNARKQADLQDDALYREGSQRAATMRNAMKNAIQPLEAAEMIPDGAVLLVGGFMGVGSPHRLIDALLERGVKDLTLINNDTARPDKGVGKLVVAGAVRKIITSHIGLNPVTQEKMFANEIEVELVPQGTLVERIRAGGVGLGGVLTADVVIAEPDMIVPVGVISPDAVKTPGVLVDHLLARAA